MAHKWATSYFTFADGSRSIPCLNTNCGYELRISKDGVEEEVDSGWLHTIHGMKLDIEDDPIGGVSKLICREVEDDYNFDAIPFCDGDIAIDIGAHVGIASIYLAKRFPFLKVYAYEPCGMNFQRLMRNIEANDVNVEAFHKAVTSDGRMVKVSGDITTNSGSMNIWRDEGEEVESVTLQEIFDEYIPGRCKLLKIDCEGSEYDILRPIELLRRIDYIRGELHWDGSVGVQHAINAANRYAQFISNVHFTASRIGER